MKVRDVDVQTLKNCRNFRRLTRGRRFFDIKPRGLNREFKFSFRSVESVRETDEKEKEGKYRRISRDARRSAKRQGDDAA